MNEAVNRQGIPCDLHVEQTKQDEYVFRHKSGNKGVVFTRSDDEVGVKLILWDEIPLRGTYVVQTPNGFLLQVKTGDVDQKLEYLGAQTMAELRDAWDDYDERVVEQKKAALEAEKKAKESEKNAEIDPELTEVDGSAIMEVNKDEEAEEEFTQVDADVAAEVSDDEKNESEKE